MAVKRVLNLPKIEQHIAKLNDNIFGEFMNRWSRYQHHGFAHPHHMDMSQKFFPFCHTRVLKTKEERLNIQEVSFIGHLPDKERSTLITCALSPHFFIQNDFYPSRTSELINTCIREMQDEGLCFDVTDVSKKTYQCLMDEYFILSLNYESYHQKGLESPHIRRDPNRPVGWDKD
jgi:hypothetical protein